MGSTIGERLAASQDWLDGVAEKVQPKVQEVVEASPRVKNAVDGTWLHTPLHPALTDVPVGAFTTAVLLDAADAASGSPVARHGADAALVVGIAGSLPAAATGASDWRTLLGEDRRLGLIHGMANGGALVLYTASLALRLADRRGAGRALSTAGFALSAFAAHLGGELSFRRGVRVDRTAWEERPTEYTPVMSESELKGTELHRAEVNGAAVLVTRSTDGKICAIADTCSHLGGPLNEGDRDGDTVACPWHGSKFDLCSGDVIEGPAVFPQPAYETRVANGRIEVRERPPAG
ncbi:MAG: hypothetical protein QOJ13_2296 [Gaiellales bacterium]|jgi:nitrite reductase/ring-hydroxylating ferredoxin subunit/uncharacterized membrane protein|nr:hypothetical protein [Gaiellales bacterium]